MRNGKEKDRLGGSGDDVNGPDALEVDGIIVVPESEGDNRGVPVSEIGDEFSPETTTDRDRIQTHINILAVSIDTFLSTRSGDEEAFKVLFDPILEYEVDGEYRVINGASLVAYFIFSDNITAINESSLYEEIKLEASPFEIEKAIEDLLAMDESDRKLYAKHAKLLFN